MENSSWKQPFHLTRRYLAKTWLKLFPKLKIVSVTGSFGKTNTTRAITQVLSQKYKTLQTDLNLDTIYNLPITLLRIRPIHQVLVLECGVDHRGEMDKHLSLFKPNVVVLTGISPVHSDPQLLGSIEGIMEEKGKLLEALPKDGWAILNHDDQLVQKMAKKTKAKVLWFGTDKDCHFWADNIQVDFQGTTFKLHFNDSVHKNEEANLRIALIGKHFVHEALAAGAVGIIYGLNLEQIKRGLAGIKPLEGRMSLKKGPGKTILLDDHLRANPASTMAGLETLEALPYQGRKIAVLGEMGELGQYAQEEHKKIGRFAAKLKIDFLVAVGVLPKLVWEEAVKSGMAKDRAFWAKDVKEAASILKKILKVGDLWYLKGSLLKHMERIVFLLEGKTVSCDLLSCHFYEQCSSCPNL